MANRRQQRIFTFLAPRYKFLETCSWWSTLMAGRAQHCHVVRRRCLAHSHPGVEGIVGRDAACPCFYGKGIYGHLLPTGARLPTPRTAATPANCPRSSTRRATAEALLCFIWCFVGSVIVPDLTERRMQLSGTFLAQVGYRSGLDLGCSHGSAQGWTPPRGGVIPTLQINPYDTGCIWMLRCSYQRQCMKDSTPSLIHVPMCSNTSTQVIRMLV